MTVKHWLLGVVLAALLIVTPIVAPSYLTFQLTGVMAYAVAAIGLNLIIGYAGQISLGHNAFFALGAYTAALSVALVVWWEWGALWRRIVRLETNATNVTAHELDKPNRWTVGFVFSRRFFFWGGKGV